MVDITQTLDRQQINALVELNDVVEVNCEARNAVGTSLCVRAMVHELGF